jgi:hypothetical protein
VKSAEETKGLVDKELVDLDKTLRNIEDARPFADLTVVCDVFFRLLRGGRLMLRNNRTMSRLQDQISINVPNNSCQRVAGQFLVTRQVDSLSLFRSMAQWLTIFVGEIWRSLSAISSPLAQFWLSFTL